MFLLTVRNDRLLDHYEPMSSVCQCSTRNVFNSGVQHSL